MFMSQHARRSVFVAVATTLGLLGSSLTVTAAHATTTAVEATSYSYTRASVNGHSISTPAHSQVSLQSSALISPDWAGWPVAAGTVLSRTALAVTSLPTGLVYNSGSAASRNWDAESSESPDTCTFGADTATYVATKADRCVDWLNVSDSLDVLNQTDGALTVDTNANLLAMSKKVGKKTTAITADSGVDEYFSAWVNLSDTSSVTLDSTTDTNLWADFFVCLDETKFSAGDTLVVTPTLSLNGSPLNNSTDVDFYDYQDLDNDQQVTTYVAPAADPFENLTVEFGASLRAAVASGSYSGTVTVTKNGTDVTETCPSSKPGYPTISRHLGGQDDRWRFTQENFSMPTQTVDAPGADDWDRYGKTADGFGGVFYWAYESTNPDDLSGSVKVVHETPTGPDNSLRADTGYITAESNEWGMVTVGRYGAAGANWYALDRQNTQWVLTTGSMTAAPVSTTTITVANASKLCPKGYTAAELFPSSATTTNPYGELYCSLKRAVSTVIVSLTPTGLVKLSGFPATSTTAPCLDYTPMEDARATGSEIAVQYYATISGKGSDKSCGGPKGAVEVRQVIAIAANGTVTKKNITKNPWGRNPEPESVTFGNRITHGDWLGLSSSYNSDTDQTGYGKIFTINATTGITLERSITFDETAQFGMWSSMRLVDEYADGRMRVVMQGTVETDGEWIGRYGVGHIDFRNNTGYVDFNDTANLSGFGYYNAKMGALFSTSSNGQIHLFTRTSDSEYTVGSWGPMI
jgi:hypothetical protein